MSVSQLEILAARGFFIDAERFADPVGIVEAAGLPLGAAHMLRAWALNLDSRGWVLTPREAEKLVSEDVRKVRPRKAA